MNALRLIASASGLATLALLGAGCPSVPGECRSDVDCASVEVCRENQCIPSSTGGDDDGGLPIDAGGGDEDAGVDAGIDAGNDVDAGVDAGIDAGSDVDAGTDAGGDDDAGDADAGDAG